MYLNHMRERNEKFFKIIAIVFNDMLKCGDIWQLFSGKQHAKMVFD